MSIDIGQIKRSRVTIQPLIEAVELQELKTQLSINDSTFDTFLNSLISSARIFIEQYLDRKLIQQEITMYMDRMIDLDSNEIWEGHRQAPRSTIQRNHQFTLEFSPIIQVDQVSTFDENDIETIFDSTNYRVDNIDHDMPTRISLKEGSVWPINLRATNAIKIVYQAGYGQLRTDVPSIIRQGILMVGAFMFENRGDCSIESALRESGAQDILNVYKTFKV